MGDRQDDAPQESQPQQPTPPPDDQVIDEMERESFPASDPPSTWAGPEPA